METLGACSECEVGLGFEPELGALARFVSRARAKKQDGMNLRLATWFLRNPPARFRPHSLKS